MTNSGTEGLLQTALSIERSLSFPPLFHRLFVSSIHLSSSLPLKSSDIESDLSSRFMAQTRHRRPRSTLSESVITLQTICLVFTGAGREEGEFAGDSSTYRLQARSRKYFVWYFSLRSKTRTSKSLSSTLVNLVPVIVLIQSPLMSRILR